MDWEFWGNIGYKWIVSTAIMSIIDVSALWTWEGFIGVLSPVTLVIVYRRLGM